MANKMIIDASHPEETRVVVLRGNRVEEFDFESASKRPLRGNIYLAKVTRVEPSLQAAFVDYGGNRHGFLAFSEIHPDYYQIPVADRQALLEEEARSQREEDAEPNGERRSRRHRRPRQSEIEARTGDGETISESAPAEDAAPDETGSASAANEPPSSDSAPAPDEEIVQRHLSEARASEPQDGAVPSATADRFEPDEPKEDQLERSLSPVFESGDVGAADEHEKMPPSSHEQRLHDDDDHEVTTLEAGSEERTGPIRKTAVEDEGEAVEQVGGDAMEELPRRPQRLRRQYKIQEVIKRRQVLLVQVVKEERGNKGAALTTYLSLAGRYSVLMPNTARGGGISRKITNAQDRSRLKSIAEDLEVPEGMGVILRTAGASRTKAEVKRDFEYLLRMWETVRETTLASSAPTLVYEEGSLIKRAIRDLYSKEVDEIVVAGEAGFREARQFMRLLMPSHVNSVQLYRDTQPVFAKAGVESQLDAMFSNQVTLKSGGYIVINQTEALFAIDVNSGRSTREHNIEDTALRTNLEAADEIARQLRLRDLAGLIVVDFIDMEESRNNRSVERRIKDALKNDRARIQVGRISHFGLLEMSRQRIRTGVLEGSTVVCTHCQGAGVVRSTASIALHVLRVLEDALIKSSTHDVIVRTRTPVALYILNQKRANLRDLERRFGVAVVIEADDMLTGSSYHAIERGEPATGIRGEAEAPSLPVEDLATIADEPAPIEEDLEDDNEPGHDESAVEGERPGEHQGAGSSEEAEAGRRRRRRRRRRGGDRPFGESIAPDAPQPTDDGLAVVAEIGGDLQAPIGDAEAFGRREPRSEGDRGRRSRRSRGGRNRFASRADEAGFGEPRAANDADGREAQAEAGYEVAPSEPGFDSTSGSGAEPVEATERSRALETPVGEIEQSPSAERSSLAREVAETPVERAVAAQETQAPDSPSRDHVSDTAPAADEPPRPRRSGWWQRARASIVGE
ncbi:MAG: Rne/Rng family ribonuclease [Roseiarcus sp.]|uniref:Rne/Rng family ribonuclease n=1 Tax=Roseiarcus sp. TaxID=1969460 RepID=UPI003C366149